MIEAIAISVFVFVVAIVLAVFTARRLIHICAPNEVLIFSGKKRRIAKRVFGYRIVKGGRGLRKPVIERVDRLDLTNMVIDVAARNAYSRGGIPLTVHGVANVKIAGFEPILNNAIERFLGKPRSEVMKNVNPPSGGVEGVRKEAKLGKFRLRRVCPRLREHEPPPASAVAQRTEQCGP